MAEPTALLLERIGHGDAAAGDELLLRLYDELHSQARGLMRNERGNHTLQATALVNEAWLRLLGGDHTPTVNDRAHFMRLSARAMRRVLVDHARRRTAKKRQQDKAEPLTDHLLATWAAEGTDIVALDDALKRLKEHDEQMVSIVELRFFVGLTLRETGEILGLTTQQTHRAWTFARGWLREHMEP